MVSIAIISVTTVIFGIGALILASRARSRLSPGSIRKYIDNFSVCVAISEADNFLSPFSLTLRSKTWDCNAVFFSLSRSNLSLCQ